MKSRLHSRFSNRRRAPVALCIVGALSLASAAAAAEPLQSKFGAAVTQPKLDLSSLSAPFQLPYAKANADALRDAVTPKTAVDHRFASGGVVGSVGYLCGVNQTAPGSNDGGPSSSYARSTTFLGAKLSLPFH